MDGLDRLIEMLEKRFGKFWADGLLLIAVLGAAAWGLHSLVVDFIVPATSTVSEIISYFRGGPITFTRGEVIYVAVQFLGTAGFIVLSRTWWRWWLDRERADVRRQALELNELLDRAVKYSEELHAQIDREVDGALAARTEVDGIVRDAKAFSAKTHADLQAEIQQTKRTSVEILEQTKIASAKIIADARAEIKSLAPSPQSPPDIEPGKQR
jgi:hypothetical protein